MVNSMVVPPIGTTAHRRSTEQRGAAMGEFSIRLANQIGLANGAEHRCVY